MFYNITVAMLQKSIILLKSRLEIREIKNPKKEPIYIDASRVDTCTLKR